MLLVRICMLLALMAQASALTVVSTHSENVTQSLLSQFRLSHPAIKITVINRRVDLIRLGVESGSFRDADIVLSSSPFLMQSLKSEHLLSVLPVLPDVSACAPGGVLLKDTDRLFASYGMAGFGMLWSQPLMEQHHLPPPRDWDDLLVPQMHGLLVMSTPSRSSTTHMVVEKILQDKGWEQGWSLLIRLGGNLGTISSRSFSVNQDLSKGAALVSPMLDSNAKALVAQYPDYRFNYFPSFAVMPTYIALLKGGKAQPAARQLLQYFYSEQGQKFLLTDTHFKLPLNAYPGFKNSEALCRMTRAQKAVNSGQLLAREQLVQVLYDQLITHHFEQLRDTWGLIQYAGEQTGRQTPQQIKNLQQARQLAAAVPVTAAQAADPRYLALFRQDSAAQRAEIKRWQRVWPAQLNQAASLARRVLLDNIHE